MVCPGFVDTAIYENAVGVKLEKEELLDKLGMPIMPASEAALAILRGTERNQGVIVFPWSARLLWRLTRLTPWLLGPFQRWMVRRLRSVRPPACSLTGSRTPSAPSSIELHFRLIMSRM